MTQQEAGWRVCYLEFTGKIALERGGYGSNLYDHVAAPFLRDEGFGKFSTISLSAMLFQNLDGS